MGEAEVTRFLSHLVTERHAALSTVNQALAALGFLHREILRRPLPIGTVIPRPIAPVRLPVVLTVGEVRRFLAELTGVYHLIGPVLYGSGLRLMECLTILVNSRPTGTTRFRRMGYQIPSSDPSAGWCSVSWGEGGARARRRRCSVMRSLARPAARADRARSAVEYGFHDGRAGGWPAIPGVDARR